MSHQSSWAMSHQSSWAMSDVISPAERWVTSPAGWWVVSPAEWWVISPARSSGMVEGVTWYSDCCVRASYSGTIRHTVRFRFSHIRFVFVLVLVGCSYLCELVHSYFSFNFSTFYFCGVISCRGSSSDFLLCVMSSLAVCISYLKILHAWSWYSSCSSWWAGRCKGMDVWTDIGDEWWMKSLHN